MMMAKAGDIQRSGISRSEKLITLTTNVVRTRIAAIGQTPSLSRRYSNIMANASTTARPRIRRAILEKNFLRRARESFLSLAVGLLVDTDHSIAIVI